MNPVLLPISGQPIRFRPLTGADEILLWSSGFPAGVADAAADLQLAAALMERVSEDAAGGPMDIVSLPVTDLDALLLLFRANLFGQTIQAEARCPDSNCGAKMDVSFGISEFLDSQAPEMPRGVRRCKEDDGENSGALSWFAFGARPENSEPSAVRFRVPTVGDLQAVAWETAPDEALFARCIYAENTIPPAMRRRIEAALFAIAPSLNSEIEGVCPDCGDRVTMAFAPRAYVLRELRGHAAFVTEEIHLLAATYHWTEADILALPASRRKAYAERIREMYSGNLSNNAYAEGSRR